MKLDAHNPDDASLIRYVSVVDRETGKKIWRVISGDDETGALIVQRQNKDGRCFQEEDPEKPGRWRIATEEIVRPFDFVLNELAPAKVRAAFVARGGKLGGRAAEGGQPRPKDKTAKKVKPKDPRAIGVSAAEGN